jgi:hypothetical protein
MNGTAYERLYDAIKAKAEYSGLYNIDDGIDRAIEDLVNNLPPAIEKQVIARVTREQKEKETAHRKAILADRKRKATLWRMTKGNIPCIAGCGNTVKRTRAQVNEGFNSCLCKACQDKGIDIMDDAFLHKDIYKVLGIM